MTYGFAGIGSASHLCSLLFFHAINTAVNGAPYKGTAPALNDLLGGHLDFMCDQTINVLQPAKSGLVKAFAATTPQRLKVAPELPTIAEFGLSDFQMVVWYAIYAPKGTPKPIVDKLSAALQKALQDPEVQERLAQSGAVDRAAGTSAARRATRSSQGRNRQVGADHQEGRCIGAIALRKPHGGRRARRARVERFSAPRRLPRRQRRRWRRARAPGFRPRGSSARAARAACRRHRPRAPGIFRSSTGVMSTKRVGRNVSPNAGRRPVRAGGNFVGVEFARPNCPASAAAPSRRRGTRSGGRC